MIDRIHIVGRDNLMDSISFRDIDEFEGSCTRSGRVFWRAVVRADDILVAMPLAKERCEFGADLPQRSRDKDPLAFFLHAAPPLVSAP